MPRMNITSQTVAANAFATLNGNTNLLAGQSYEFLPQDAHVVLGIAGAATGLQASFIVANSVTVMDDQPISTVNRFPSVMDDVAFEDDVPPGRLILKVRNTTGAGIVLNGAFVDITF